MSKTWRAKTAKIYARNAGRRKRSMELVYNVAAVVLLLVIVFGTVHSLSKENMEITDANVAAMRTPYMTVDRLYKISMLENMNFPQLLSTYMIYNDFFPAIKEGETYNQLLEFSGEYKKIRSKYKKKDLKLYDQLLTAILEDVSAFPIKDEDYGRSGYIFSDSFGASRQGVSHLGTDIIDRENSPGRLEALSISDGVVEKIGAGLEQGFSLTILSPGGLEFRYANLQNVNPGLVKGSQVSAGDFIGYVGYGEEGNGDGYPVRLHIEMKAPFKDKFIPINPYIFLRFIEN